MGRKRREEEKKGGKVRNEKMKEGKKGKKKEKKKRKKHKCPYNSFESVNIYLIDYPL